MDDERLTSDQVEELVEGGFTLGEVDDFEVEAAREAALPPPHETTPEDV